MKRYILLGLAASVVAAYASELYGDTGRALTSTTPLIAVSEVSDPELAFTSGGQASATIEFTQDFTAAWISVRFTDLDGYLTRVRLTCQQTEYDEEIVIGVIDRVEPNFDNRPDVQILDEFISGTLTNASFPNRELTGAARCFGARGQAIDSLALLAAAIDTGRIYWNLYTSASPHAELRGLVRAMER